METMTDFIVWGLQKSLRVVSVAMKLKDTCSLAEARALPALKGFTAAQPTCAPRAAASTRDATRRQQERPCAQRTRNPQRQSQLCLLPIARNPMGTEGPCTSTAAAKDPGEAALL